MPSNRWVVLALLFAVRVSTGIQYQAVASLSPQLMSGFVLSIADIGLLIGLYHAPGTILAFPGGAIGAWLGDKPVVLIGLALMAIGEIAAATAPSWPILMGARIVAGTGGILLNVMIIKMVADWFTSKETATAMAIIGSSAPAGIALALATIPWIASSGDRVLASISVVVYLVLAFVALAAAYKAPDEASAVAQRQSLWPERRVVVCLITAGLIYGLYNVGLVTILAFGPLMLTERGWSFAAGSSATSLVLWIVTISLPAGGLLADRIGRRAVVLVCGLLAFAATMAVAPRVDAVFAIFLLLGITSGLPCGAIMALPTQVLAPETRSVGMGIMFTVYYAPDASGISTEGMQKIAREFNFGETTFVLPKNDPANTCRLRIFTRRTELDFAGAPTVLCRKAPRTMRPGPFRVHPSGIKCLSITGVRNDPFLEVIPIC